MHRRRSRLTEQDRAEWAQYVRHVAPLTGRGADDLPLVAPVMPGPDFAGPMPAVQIPRVAAPPAAMRSPIAAPLVVGRHPPGVDSGTWLRFSSGKLKADRTLDLHGRTAQRAFGALAGFLRSARADGVRCVEIITGRGSGEAGGVLRRELPFWLNLPELRPLVLAAAHPHAANLGSVRVLLRKTRHPE